MGGEVLLIGSDLPSVALGELQVEPEAPVGHPVISAIQRVLGQMVVIGGEVEEPALLRRGQHTQLHHRHAVAVAEEVASTARHQGFDSGIGRAPQRLAHQRTAHLGVACVVAHKACIGTGGHMERQRVAPVAGGPYRLQQAHQLEPSGVARATADGGERIDAVAPLGSAVVEAAVVVDGQRGVAALEAFHQALVAVLAEPAARLLLYALVVGRYRRGVLLRLHARQQHQYEEHYQRYLIHIVATIDRI